MTLKDLESKLIALTSAEKQQVIQFLTQSLESMPPEIAKPLEISRGEARIGNTQIAVWEVVNAKDIGYSDEDILQAYPQLTRTDLATAWDYAAAHPQEIALALQEIDE
jgi:uncharacterized protein (DUF433 family)